MMINLYKKIIYIIIGFFIVCAVFYKRFVYINLPKNLFFYEDDINYKIIFLTFLSVIIFSYLLYKNINNLLNIGCSRITTVLVPQIKYNHIIRRSMVSTSRILLLGKEIANASSTQLTIIARTSIPQRNYAGKYEAVVLDPAEHPVKGDGKPIPKHEMTHNQIQDVESRKVFALFTTSPKPKDDRYYKISDEKVDGTPDTKGTGQYVGVMNHPKRISSPKILKKKPEYQGFLDKNENKLDATCEDRTSKDDARFYNENGTKDDENYPDK